MRGLIQIEDDGWRELKIAGLPTVRIDLLSFVYEMNDFMTKLPETVPLGVGTRSFLASRAEYGDRASELSAFAAQCVYNQLMNAADELQKKDPCSQLADSPPSTGGQCGSVSELNLLPGLSLTGSATPPE